MVEEDAGARQKNYTALDHTDCLAVCRRAARLNGREGRWREMVANGLFSQQKIETKCQGQSFVQNRFRTRNHSQHTNSYNQPAERTTRSTRQQRKNTHSTKQSNHARQQQHSTARQPRHPAKKNQKRRKKSTVKSQNLQFWEKICY